MAHTELVRISRTPEPTWLQRMLGAMRSYTLGPLTSNSKELARLWNGGSRSGSGIVVNESDALSYSPVWCAVRTISDDASSLPLPLYRSLPDGGKEKFYAHPLYRLLNEAPNPEMTAMVARRTIIAHALLYGNGYAEIERDASNRPIAVWPLVPELVAPFRVDGGPLRYKYQNPNGAAVIYDASDMIHLVGPSHDGSVGAVFVHHARESLGLGIAAERFGGAFFGNGATFGGVISYKGPKPPELSERSNREALEARHVGVERAHKFLALYNDATYTRMGIPPNDAQFLETRVFQIREVARWFKMPPHMLGDLADATYSNVEQMRDAYYTSCLRPWLVLFEQELKKKLIALSERNIQVIEHVVEGFLRADTAGRGEFHSKQFNIGAITPNEIRLLENRNPLPGGDRLFVMRNMIPLDRYDEIIDAEVAAAKPLPPIVPQPKAIASVDDLEARMVIHAEKLSAEAARAASAEALAEQRAGDVVSLTVDRDALAGTVAEREAALLAAEDRRAREVQAATAAGVEQTNEVTQRAEREIQQLTGDLQAIRAEKNDTDLMLGVAERLRDEAIAARDALTLSAAELTQHVADLTGEREALKLAQAASDVTAAELRAQVEQEQARFLARQAQAELDKAAAADREAQLIQNAVALALEREALKVAQATAEGSASELRAQLLEQANKIADYDESANRLTQLGLEVNSTNVQLRAAGDAAAERARAAEAAHNAAVAQLAAVRASHRTLIVDAVDRLLQREVDRARKAQSTPEKLRTWIENFYPLHEDTCRAALRPVLQAWATSAGVDLATVLDREVSAHVDESVRTLRQVAQHDDPDALAAGLERVLRRWETERAAGVADRLLREGEDACRKVS